MTKKGSRMVNVGQLTVLSDEKSFKSFNINDWRRFYITGRDFFCIEDVELYIQEKEYFLLTDFHVWTQVYLEKNLIN